MKNETLPLLQIIILVVLGLTLILQAVLYFSVNSRMATIEQKQAVLENRLDVIQGGGSISR